MIVLKREPDLTNRGIDSLTCIDVDVVTPEPPDDLVASHKLTFAPGQQGQEFHGDLFEL